MSSIKLFLFILLLPFVNPPTGQDDTMGLVVIVNSANNTAALTKSEVKLTYLRKINKRWPGINKNIVPVDRRDMPETKKLFLAKLLNMSSQDMTRYFTEREYMNAEMPPVTFSSDAEIIDYVGENVGAIGYVNVNSINGDNKSKVRVVYPDKH